MSAQLALHRPLAIPNRRQADYIDGSFQGQKTPGLWRIIKLVKGTPNLCFCFIFCQLLTIIQCYFLPQLKCAQYWPQKEEKEMIFEDTNLKLTLISEDIKSYYTVRQLELENLTVSVVCASVLQTAAGWGAFSLG